MLAGATAWLTRMVLDRAGQQFGEKGRKGPGSTHDGAGAVSGHVLPGRVLSPHARTVETGQVAERLWVHEIDDDESRRLVRTAHQVSGVGGGLAAGPDDAAASSGMDVAAIAKLGFTSEDRVQDLIRNFNAYGFSSSYPTYKGGWPPKFSLLQRWEIKKIAKSKPAEHCRVSVAESG